MLVLLGRLTESAEKGAVLCFEPTSVDRRPRAAGLPRWRYGDRRTLPLRSRGIVTRQGMSLSGWARSMRELFVGDRARSITHVGDRAYVEYRGVDRADLSRFSAAIRERT